MSAHVHLDIVISSGKKTKINWTASICIPLVHGQTGEWLSPLCTFFMCPTIIFAKRRNACLARD